MVVGLAPPSLLVSVAVVNRPNESRANVVVTCGAVLWLPPFTKYRSTCVGATAQTATGLSGPSALPRLAALSPVRPEGGRTGWAGACVSCRGRPAGSARQ